MSEHLLQVMLPMAVGFRILEVLQLPEDQRPKPTDLILCLECGGRAMGCAVCGDHGKLRRQEAYAQFMAYHGDELQYGGKKGAAAKAFNVMAEAVAMMSLVPGGIEVFGQRYDASVLEGRFKRGAQLVHRIIRKTDPDVRKVRKPA